uniref:Uncharacterized protein n=1 Tax=Anguilla anguilla TaxID=7936 RepID=A0A0E9XXP8_ANGAN
MLPEDKSLFNLLALSKAENLKRTFFLKHQRSVLCSDPVETANFSDAVYWRLI